MLRSIVLLILALAVITAALVLLLVNPTQRRKQTIRTAVSPAQLRAHVEALAVRFEPRNYQHPHNLDQCASYVSDYFRHMGAQIADQPYTVNGVTYRNVIAVFGPDTPERIVVGAHYDAVIGTSGADDNASGVAGLLELANLLGTAKLNTRVELVAYSTEEPPFFGSAQMGSAVHARSLKQAGVKVRAMFALEMIGYFSDAPGSQHFPLESMRHLYGDRGNFIVIAARPHEEFLTRRIKTSMAVANGVEVYSINAPAIVAGIGLSDHSSYWNEGYPAVMITDSAFFRNQNYHLPTDTPDTLNYERMAQVVTQLRAAVVALANE